MKKTVCFILCVVLAVVLTACAKNSANYIENCYDFKLEDYIKLGQYKGYVIELDNPKPTEEEIQAALDEFMDGYAKYVEPTRETIQMGDKVNITFEGSLDGVRMDSMCGTKSDLIIGSHAFIGTFEEQLIGAKVGDTVTVVARFPDNYSHAEFRGKDGVFVTTINSFLEKQVPELTDEFINEQTDYTDIEAFRKHLAEQIETTNRQSQDDEYYDRLWAKIVDSTEMKKYPENLVKMLEKDSKESLEFIAKNYYGMTLEEYVTGSGMTMEEFEEYNSDNAHQVARNRLIIYAICAAENIKIYEAEYKLLGVQYAKESGFETLEEMEKTYSRTDIVTDMAREKVFDLIYKENTLKIKD